ARLANACRFDGAQRRLELLLHQLFDRVSDSQPHRQLDAVRAERRNLFLLAWLLGTVLHRVILPAPAAKRARSSWLELRRMMTRFLLFHQTQDTTRTLRSPGGTLDQGTPSNVRTTSRGSGVSQSPQLSSPLLRRPMKPGMLATPRTAVSGKQEIPRKTSH